MIQRIQTAYMLAVTALLCVVVFVPMARFASPDGDFAIMSYGLRSFTSEGGTLSATTSFSWWSVCSAVLLSVSALLPFVAIFFYKKRILQIRLLAIECVLLFGSLFFCAYYLWMSFREIAPLSSGNYMTYTLLLPAVGFVLTVMAIKAIGRDEALVRSMDRIR